MFALKKAQSSFATAFLVLGLVVVVLCYMICFCAIWENFFGGTGSSHLIRLGTSIPIGVLLSITIAMYILWRTRGQAKE